MFYRTQIKATGAGYAIDTSGKRLIFAANYPCKAGDSVWTDGKIIFGNVANKPQPVIFDEEPSGIPVSFGTGNELKKGYITSSGKFRKYPITGSFSNVDSSIVNDDKKYYQYKNNTNWDTEIDENGELLSIEKKIDIRHYDTEISRIDEKDFIFRMIILERFEREEDGRSRAMGLPLDRPYVEAVKKYYEEVSGDDVRMGADIDRRQAPSVYEDDGYEVIEDKTVDGKVISNEGEDYGDGVVSPLYESALIALSNSYFWDITPFVFYIIERKNYNVAIQNKVNQITEDAVNLFWNKAAKYLFDHLVSLAYKDGGVIQQRFETAPYLVEYSDLFLFESGELKGNWMTPERYPDYFSDFDISKYQSIIDTMVFYREIGNTRYAFKYTEDEIKNSFEYLKTKNFIERQIGVGGYCGNGVSVRLVNAKIDRKQGVKLLLEVNFAKIVRVPIFNGGSYGAHVFPTPEDDSYINDPTLGVIRDPEKYPFVGKKLFIINQIPWEYFAVTTSPSLFLFDNGELTEIEDEFSFPIQDDFSAHFKLKTKDNSQNDSQDNSQDHSDVRVYSLGSDVYTEKILGIKNGEVKESEFSVKRWDYDKTNDFWRVVEDNEKIDRANYVLDYISIDSDTKIKFNNDSIRYDSELVMTKLSGNNYLFGERYGGLFKISGNEIEKIGDGLRNFRLRKLKNISTARK